MVVRGAFWYVSTGPGVMCHGWAGGGVWHVSGTSVELMCQGLCQGGVAMPCVRFFSAAAGQGMALYLTQMGFRVCGLLPFRQGGCGACVHSCRACVGSQEQVSQGCESAGDNGFELVEPALMSCVRYFSVL